MTQESGNKSTSYYRNRKARLAYQKEYYWRNKERILEKEREKKKVDPEYKEQKRVYNERYFAANRSKIYGQRKALRSKRASSLSKQAPNRQNLTDRSKNEGDRSNLNSHTQYRQTDPPN